jgi:formate C-acetyltransferase
MMLMINSGETLLPHQLREVSPRISRLKEKIRNSPLKIFLQRSLLYIESYKKTEREPVIIRRAKALKHILENMTIRIDSDEIIVGGRTPYPRMGLPSTEGDVEWLLDELDTISDRLQDPFTITEEEKEVFKREVYPYFQDKTLKKYIFDHLSDEILEECENDLFTLNQKDHSQGHIVPDVEKWIKLGINGITREVLEAKKNATDREKIDFYSAVFITLEGARIFILRYAELAENMKLDEIRDICVNLSSRPPRNFKEAIQSIWFLIVILILESIGNAFSPGRLDRILYDYYKNDVGPGGLTDEDVIDIIEAFYLKLNEVVVVRSHRQAKYFAGFPMGFNVLLGGQDDRRNDATNELSYLFLKAEADLLLPQPNLSVRIHSGSPERFLHAVGYVISKGNGMPQVFNDEAIIPALINRGFKVDDARNYAVIGCVELCIPGKFLGLSNAAMMNMARLFEVSFGEKLHMSYSELEQTIKTNLERSVKLMAQGSNIVDRAHAHILPTPFLSSVIFNCVEKGKDVSRGGAFFNFTGLQAVGIANIADSLLSVRKIVYENKDLGYQQLAQMLDENFKGHEIMRKKILEGIPKYGNGIEDVDDIAHKWSFLYNLEVERYTNPREGGFQPGLYTVSAHVPLGQVVGATPDGRLKGEPLADGGVSPMRGRDRKGPLAVIESVSRVDQMRATNGTLLNLKFHPSVFEGEGAIQKFAGLLRGFMQHQCFHVQFNVISGDTLRKAQSKPDDYRDLVIRVAGYSAFFIELNETLQNDIVERTEYAG